MKQSSQPTDMFCRRLRDIREKRALSQGALAQRAGLKAAAVSHFETGTRKPSFDNLRRLADALEVTTDYLLGRVDDAQALAGADKLHRHYHELSSEDREIAEDFIELLAKKAHRRTRSRKE